jgi:hypothetical protein
LFGTNEEEGKAFKVVFVGRKNKVFLITTKILKGREGEKTKIMAK